MGTQGLFNCSWKRTQTSAWKTGLENNNNCMDQLNHLVMDRDGYNALELAIKAGHQSVVEVLNTIILDFQS